MHEFEACAISITPSSLAATLEHVCGLMEQLWVHPDETNTPAFLDEALKSRSVRLIWVDPQLFHQAANMFKSGSERGWRFTDCTSFELMHRLKIMEVFAFDRHFDEAGFNRLPKVLI